MAIINNEYTALLKFFVFFTVTVYIVSIKT